MVDDNFLADRVELQSIIESLNQLESGDTLDLGCGHSEIRDAFERALRTGKSTLLSSAAYIHAVFYDQDLDEGLGADPSKPVAWTLSLTDAFVKETKGIDRKLQGRILEGLLELIDAPMTIKGDTCKPLSGKLAGLWRLRIGHTRLVYKPDTRMHVVFCLSFSSRGEAYR